MRRLRYFDLYYYLARNLNATDVYGVIEYDCCGSLKYTRRFCRENGVDFEKLKSSVLDKTQASRCDCEVLNNTTLYISDRAYIPQRLYVSD